MYASVLHQIVSKKHSKCKSNSTHKMWFSLFSREHGADGTERLNPSAASSQVVDNPGPTTSKVSIKQEPGAVTNVATGTVPKLTIKSESLKRTVVAQTLSTTFVHVSELQMLPRISILEAFNNVLN